ncbi:MAG TPA: tetratricopeptide repeat protein [Terriglobales bacterium]|nr:tetratricopeptide repeat protein [Terriglobales bacterium]
MFALHPAQTESVAWVTVPDPLMSAGVLGALLLYLKYVERRSAEIHANAEKSRRKSRKQKRDNSSAWGSKAWLVASVASFLAALLAKETAIVLPAVIFIFAVAFPLASREAEQSKPRRIGYRSRLIFAFGDTLPFLLATAIYLFCRSSALGRWLVPATQHLSRSTVLLSWPAVLWFYLKVLLWPVRSRAFADPNLAEKFSLRGVMLPGLGVVCALAILASGCLWAWRRAERDLPEPQAEGVKRALVIGVCLLVLPIVLTLNLNALNPGDFLHGRYTYLPLAGLMILLATGWRLSTKGRTVLLLASGLAALAFSVLTVQQESAWKDDLTIFTVAHQNAPRNAPVAQNLARAHVQVGLGLDEAGHCDQAVPIFEQAIQQYPQDWFAWAALGECRFKLNDLAGAEQSLRRAFELSHEARVKEEWEAVRAKMGLPSEPRE